MKPVNRIVLIGMFTAVNVASRLFLQFLPNVKPITSIIILSTIAFGLTFGIELALATVLVAGLLFGFGTFIPFQILAWVLIALCTYFLDRLLTDRKIMLFALWTFLCGYIYGFFVSIDKLLISPAYFWAYYLNGLTFDTFHAVGNLVFYPLCYRVLLPLFRRYSAQPGFMRDRPA